MFDHVTIRVTDRAASEAFYETVLGTLGVERTSTGRQRHPGYYAAYVLDPGGAIVEVVNHHRA